jgi:phytoene dehydrogenase-like protein
MSTHDVDAVVIGSGAGGMAAGVALARAGQKVLVLEQHYVPGGWCHSFTLGGHRFSPGVHYLGELGPEGRLRAIYEGLGLGDELTFMELNPDGFDRVWIGDGERFDIPKGADRLAYALCQRFPAEAKGIHRYLGTVARISDQLGTMMRIRSPLDVVALPLRAPTILRHGMRRLGSLMDDHVHDPVLRTILAAQCGDHGLPPSQAPAAIHAAVAGHYFGGGWYPKGGGFALPRAFLRGLKKHGGELKLRSEVAQILTERRGRRYRAVGVRLADGTEVRAKTVISNADPAVTYGRLLPRERLSRTLQKRVDGLRWGVSALSLFLGVDMDLASMGFDSGNIWWSANADLDAMYTQRAEHVLAEDGEFPGLFVTVTTLKDRTKRNAGGHTVEAFALAPWEAFKPWAATANGERGAEYEALKERLTRKMLRTLERVIPGVSSHLNFCELGTPLTNVHFVEATEGSLYGTEKSRWQVGPFAFGTGTEIEGLHQCGASTISHGVMGATMSGVAAARQILGCRMRDLLQEGGPQIRTVLCDDTTDWPDDLRKQLVERDLAVATA